MTKKKASRRNIGGPPTAIGGSCVTALSETATLLARELGPDHPRVKMIHREIEALKRRLAVTGSVPVPG